MALFNTRRRATPADRDTSHDRDGLEAAGEGVINGTRFTPVHLHVPDTSGTDFTGVLLW